jgi:hypothetical protein
MEKGCFASSVCNYHRQLEVANTFHGSDGQMRWKYLSTISCAFMAIWSTSQTAEGETVDPAGAKPCIQEASQAFINLLFPETLQNPYVVAFSGAMPALEIAAAKNIYHGPAIRVPEAQQKVFRLSEVDTYPEYNDEIVPSLYIFDGDKTGDLTSANTKYVKLYTDIIADGTFERTEAHSEHCDFVAFHHKGKIEKAFLIFKTNEKARELEELAGTKGYNPVYEQYLFPVDVCGAKAAIALNGGWGIFSYPDSFFDYTMPRDIITSFNECFDGLKTSGIRPGMTYNKVVSLSKRF